MYYRHQFVVKSERKSLPTSLPKGARYMVGTMHHAYIEFPKKTNPEIVKQWAGKGVTIQKREYKNRFEQRLALLKASAKEIGYWKKRHGYRRSKDKTITTKPYNRWIKRKNLPREPRRSDPIELKTPIFNPPKSGHLNVDGYFSGPETTLDVLESTY